MRMNAFCGMLCACMVLFSLRECVASAGSFQDYIVTDVGTLPAGVLCYLTGINNRGEAVGSSDSVTFNGVTGYGVIYAENGIHTISYESVGNSINNREHVVGSDSNEHAFLYYYATDQILDLNSLMSTNSGWTLQNAIAINDCDTIIGTGINPSGITSSFLYSNGSVLDLNMIGDNGSVVVAALNNSNQVVGTFTTNGVSHSFLYSSNVMWDLNTFIITNSGWILQTATAINDRGQITGIGINSNGCAAGFLYSQGTIEDLGNISPIGINKWGQIIGSSLFDNTNHFFMSWNGVVESLGDCIPEDSSVWTLQLVSGINDSGQIVGTGLAPSLIVKGVDMSGPIRGFILNPLPTVSLVFSNGLVLLTMGGFIGKSFSLECSDNIEGSVWKTIYTYNLTNCCEIYTDTSVSNQPVSKFYRVLQLP